MKNPTATVLIFEADVVGNWHIDPILDPTADGCKNRNRHGSGKSSNYAFVDGHCEAVTMTAMDPTKNRTFIWTVKGSGGKDLGTEDEAFTY